MNNVSRQTYPELERARRCWLVVVGVEVGGRFGAEAADFLRLLGRHSAESTPAVLRPAARAAWLLQWSGLLADASSLLELPFGESCVAGPAPELHELLADARWEQPVPISPALRRGGGRADLRIVLAEKCAWKQNNVSRRRERREMNHNMIKKVEHELG